MKKETIQKVVGFLLAIIILVVAFWVSRIINFSIDRDVVMTAFDLAINDLVSEDPIEDSRWRVQEFRFVDDKGFYVEYGDGASAKAFVVEAKPTFPVGIDYDFIGELKTSSKGFIVASGTDPFVGEPFDIYRKNYNINEWEKVNR